MSLANASFVIQNLQARILEQRNALFRTELSIGFTDGLNTEAAPFRDLPDLLLDVPHEVFRGMGRSEGACPVGTYWLVRGWGEA